MAESKLCKYSTDNVRKAKNPYLYGVFTILGCAVPTAAMTLMYTVRRSGARATESVSRDVRSEPLGSSEAGRWEGFAEEIAQFGHTRRRRSDAATRRRHLAAVLPADARR